MQDLATASATERLSDRQRQCLSLIGAGRSPKEVAVELDLSVETVHAHLKAARRTLGVGSSKSAAAMIAVPHAESVGNHTLVMGVRASGMHLSASGPTGTRANRDADELHDVRPMGGVGNWNDRRTLKGRLDHVTPAHRVLIMALGLAGTVVVLAGLLATANGLQQLLWSIFKPS